MKQAARRPYLSKAVRLSAQIRQEIENGKYPLGSLLPTEVQMVKVYDVSRVTLRRCLDRLIEEGMLTKLPYRGVMVQDNRMGKRIDLPAHAMSDARCNIAAVLLGRADETIARFHRGIEAFTRDHEMGFQVVIDNPEESIDTVFQQIEDLQLQGVIIYPYPGERYQKLLKQLRQKQLPSVCIEQYSYEGDMPIVSSDCKAGMYRATKYLITNYQQPVFFIGLKNNTKPYRDRYEGYVQAMEDHAFADRIESCTALSSDEMHLVTERPWQTGYDMAQHIFDQDHAELSIICLNDELAWGVYRAAEERGLEIGSDIRVIGFGDFEIATLLSPSLTTVCQHYHEEGYQAGKLLRECIDGHMELPVHMVLPVELIQRDSA